MGPGDRKTCPFIYSRPGPPRVRQKGKRRGLVGARRALVMYALEGEDLCGTRRGDR